MKDWSQIDTSPKPKQPETDSRSLPWGWVIASVLSLGGAALLGKALFNIEAIQSVGPVLAEVGLITTGIYSAFKVAKS